MEHERWEAGAVLTRQRKVASVINLWLGIWLMIAGLALSATSTAMRDDIIVGILVFAFASWRLSRTASSAPSWLNFILSIWLLFAGTALHYASAASRWNDFAVGVVVIILSVVSGSAGGQAQTDTKRDVNTDARNNERRAA